MISVPKIKLGNEIVNSKFKTILKKRGIQHSDVLQEHQERRSKQSEVVKRHNNPQEYQQKIVSNTKKREDIFNA